jgi:hypothetical protein
MVPHRRAGRKEPAGGLPLPVIAFLAASGTMGGIRNRINKKESIMQKSQKAAGVFLTPLLLAALVMALTGCPNPEDPEPDEGFAKLLSSDGASSGYFGSSVSISGDYAIVGACGGSLHAAYIFVRSGSGWTQQAKLTPSDGGGWDYFGCSVSISGDYAIVGSQYHRLPGKENAGAAYVFVRSGTTWTEQAKLTASDSAGGDQFGQCVSICGNDVIVSSYARDNNKGVAWVFVRSGGTWTEQAKLTASDGTGWEMFGISASISGDYAIVGACGDDSYKGSAYVFERSGATWTEQPKLTADDGAAGDYFGMSVSISGDSALVGANGDDSNMGAAYVFVRSSTDWTQQARLTAGDRANGDQFGRSVSLDGDRAIMGAFGDDDQGSDSGSTYVFERSGVTWTEQPKLIASDGDAGESFGCAVSIDGDRAIVGARTDDENGSNSGSAYIFY